MIKFFACRYLRYIPSYPWHPLRWFTSPRLISTPPLPELLKVWNECETKLVVEAQRLVDGGEVVPPIAFLPLEKGAYVGAREGSVGFGDGDEDLMERVCI